MKIIYKIATEEQWRVAGERGRFDGAPIDLQDGFIHFSDAASVRETAAKHFTRQDDLVLVAVDADRLGDALKWEVSRGGALFPHLYAFLPLEAVLWTTPLPLDDYGRHLFPTKLA